MVKKIAKNKSYVLISMENFLAFLGTCNIKKLNEFIST